VLGRELADVILSVPPPEHKLLRWPPILDATARRDLAVTSNRSAGRFEIRLGLNPSERTKALIEECPRPAIRGTHDICK
jgi:hypothetical protein